jgi:hypothetical protein
MPRPPSFARSTVLVASVLLILGSLVACSASDGASAGATFDVAVADPDGVQPAALTQVMVDGGVLSPADLVEIDDGVWLGNTVDASARQTVTVSLPSGEELPAGLLANVASAFVNTTAAPDCDVQATPSTARVSHVFFELVVAPGVAAFNPAEGLVPVLPFDAERDLDGC